MTLREIYRELDARFPTSLSCSWDSDGEMICLDPDATVHKILCVLDVDTTAVERAVTGKFDLIVSHHPFLFHPVAAFTGASPTAVLAARLIRHGISVFSFHTRADAAQGGVNDALAARLGLRTAGPLCPDGMGRIAVLPAPMELCAFAVLVRERLHAPLLRYSGDGRAVSTVALLGGEGKEDLPHAAAAGVDLFLTGRVGYHAMMDAAAGGLPVMEAGHYQTEAPFVDTLAELLTPFAGTVVSAAADPIRYL